MGAECSAAELEVERTAPPTALDASPTSSPMRTWGDLYSDHADFVWRSLRRMGLSHDAAKDALHDVFLVVHRRFDSFDPNLGTERAWLFGIAANVVRSERRRKVPVSVENLEPLMDRREALQGSPSVSGEFRVGYLRVREKIMAAVSNLAPERRAVFSMFELEGLSCLEIADEMGVAIGTVYSRLHAARVELRTALAEYRPVGTTGEGGA